MKESLSFEGGVCRSDRNKHRRLDLFSTLSVFGCKFFFVFGIVIKTDQMLTRRGLIRKSIPSSPTPSCVSFVVFLYRHLCRCRQLLRSHAAMNLGKKPDQLTGEDESRMAYAIGNGVYTISRLSAHLGVLTAGLPTE